MSFLRRLLGERTVDVLRRAKYRALALNPRRLLAKRRFERANKGLGQGEIALRETLRLAVEPEARAGFEYFAFRDLDMVRELDGFLAHRDERTRLLDVGALHGVFSLAFTHGRPEAEALALEPSPLAFPVLVGNVRRNQSGDQSERRGRITPLEIAVGSSPGSVSMRLDWHHLEAVPQGADGALEIPLDTIDRLCAERGFEPDLIKIDVEGYELEVLRGAERVLSQGKPDLFLEAHPRALERLGASAVQVHAVLAQHGYRVFDSEARPISRRAFERRRGVGRYQALAGERARSMAIRARLRRGARLFLGLFLAFAVGEMAARIWDASRGPTGSLYSLIIPRDGERFRLRPQADLIVPERYGDIRYRLNSLGYRDVERTPMSATSPSRRLVILGDSVSFGLGVGQEQIYPARLERELAARFRPPYEVVNLAIFAYHTLDELAAFEDEGHAFRPEVTVLQFYWNDLTLRFDASPESTVPIEPPLRARVTAAWNQTVYRSALYRRLHQLAAGTSFRLLHDLRRERFPESLNEDEIRADAEYLAANPDDASIETFVAIERVQRAVAASGSKFLVLLSPDEVQLFRSDYDAATERVRDFLDSRGIVYLDPLPALRARNDRARLFLDGVHYSSRGHEVVARLLAADLARRGWVADSPRAEAEPSR